MIDFLQGYILVAYRNTIIYMNVEGTGICEGEPVPKGNVGKNFVTVNITEDLLYFLNLN